jgi:hypothetical protein
MHWGKFVRVKLLRVWGLMAFSAVGLYAMPPTTGAQYWSTDPNLDCSAFHALISEIQLASGRKGYACFVSGTFPWLAAGGSWRTSIRIDAPASGAIGMDLGFFQDGQRFSMDVVSGNGLVPAPTLRGTATRRPDWYTGFSIVPTQPRAQPCFRSFCIPLRRSSRGR